MVEAALGVYLSTNSGRRFVQFTHGLYLNYEKNYTDMANENAEKLKALKLTIDKLEKSYGKGVVMKMDDDSVVNIPSISTGSLGLDMALGIGGLPKGRVVEIYGPEASGKTTLAMHCVAEAQKKGWHCCLC